MTEKDLEMEEMEGMENLILVDDDNVEHEFQILDVMQVEGKQYAILLPLDTDLPEEEQEAVIMRLDLDENNEEMFSSIDDDAEWDAVVNAYNNAMWDDEE